MRQRASSGFTLIELLVVIAIIAILAAILFPVFSRARENARKSTCQSNIRQIAMAVLQYVQDWDEYLPLHYHRAIAGQSNADLVASRPRGPWVNCIRPYVKDKGVFLCPSDLQNGRWKLEDANAASFTVYDPPLSYGWNYNFVYNMPRKMAEIEEPACIIMLCEQSDRLPYGRWFNKPGNKEFVWRYNRHMDGANYAWWDGHIKWKHGALVPKQEYNAPERPTYDFRFEVQWP